MSDNLESSAVITVKKTFNQFDRNGFSHHATNIIGGATVWTNFHYTHLITAMYNMLELYKLIQDLREF